MDQYFRLSWFLLVAAFLLSLHETSAAPKQKSQLDLQSADAASKESFDIELEKAKVLLMERKRSIAKMFGLDPNNATMNDLLKVVQNNATFLNSTLGRESRNYGGMGCGGYGGGGGGDGNGLLLALLLSRNRGFDDGPSFGLNPGSNNNGMDAGQLGFLTLLGLALISRFPTQG